MEERPIKETITLEEVLELLGIEEYKERILNSNSHGELFHINDYFVLSQIGLPKEKFSKWFKEVVQFAEKNWKRPESVFQHILTIFKENLTNHADNSNNSSTQQESTG